MTDTIDTLRAQRAEAQRELIAKEAERAGLELERNNAQRQHTMQCAINKTDSQRILELTAENEQLREQRNRIGLCIGHALSGGRKDDHEAGLSERMNAIRALIAERNEWQASRIAYANEFPLNADGEPDVVNIHANIRSLKAQLAEAQRDAERWRWLKDHARIFRQSPDMSGNHYWMVHATTTLRGPTLDAAIDAAKGEPS